MRYHIKPLNPLLAKKVFFFTFMLQCLFAIAQSDKAPDLQKKVIRISTPVMRIPETDSNTILLRMTFNGSIPQHKLDKIKINEVASVSLVYTKFKVSETFNQLELNARRMDQLYSLMPGLRDNKNVQWYWVEQTGCNDPTGCGDFFHGFIINLTPTAEELKRTTEFHLLDYYTTMYEGKGDTRKMDSLIATGKSTLKKICHNRTYTTRLRGNKMGRISGWNGRNKSKLERYLRQELGEYGEYIMQLVMNEKGDFHFADDAGQPQRAKSILEILNNGLRVIPARYKSKRISTAVSLQVKITDKKVVINSTQKPILPDGKTFYLDSFLYHIRHDTSCEYIDTSMWGAYSPGISYNYQTPDVVTKVLDRNSDWRNCLVATDVTGSMYPYLAQFRVWHRLHLKSGSGNHDFVFFNDGDNKPDYLKRSGHVGGNYFVHTSNFDELDSAMTLSMTMGGGGDAPENNIEAVLEGLKANPSCKAVIMIADNNAIPRDLELLRKIHVPIRLILCGTQWGSINTAYLEMVRANRGSIHTMEEDVTNLARMMEGETVKLDGKEYVLKGGKFKLVTEKSN